MKNQEELVLITKGIENIALSIESFLNLRDFNDLKIVENEIFVIERRLDEILKGSQIKNKLKIKFLENIKNKLNDILFYLEKIKEKEPVTYFFAFEKMTEILIKNINRFIEYDFENSSKDIIEIVKKDYKTLYKIKESSERVIITYLLEKPSNMKEVLALLNIKEIYISIMENIICAIDYCFGESNGNSI